ncbi:MAG: DUF4340 domain-containing protein [Candidatus Sericytochromatia bacterium]|nr:DUF4340 domain-containing protein [Candidatus Sericytochromatia bacterium]
MKSDKKFTLGLVAAALAMGAYMVFVEAKKDAPLDTKDLEVWSLSEAQAGNLKRLVVETGGKKVTFVREGDTWSIPEMKGREVDQINFKGPYDKLRTLLATRKLESGEANKATYGLDNPSGTLTWGDDTTPYKLTFGATTPTGDGVYTHVAKDDGVYTVAKYKVDEWKNLAFTPPLLPLPSPSPSPSKAPAAAPSAAAGGASAPATSPAPSAAAASTAPAASAAPAGAGHDGHHH